MEDRVLEYGAKVRPPGRRTAVVAFGLSLLATPPAMFGLFLLTADRIDDWLRGPALYAVLYAMACGPGLAAAGLGVASQRSGRRWLGVAAIVLGTLSTFANAILLTLALAA